MSEPIPTTSHQALPQSKSTDSEQKSRCYQVTHATEYTYENSVSLSQQQLHLTPRQCPWQDVLNHTLTISPEPNIIEKRTDFFGNPISQFAIESTHNSLEVTSQSLIKVCTRQNLPVFKESISWNEAKKRLSFGAHPVHKEAHYYQFESPFVRIKHEFSDYAESAFQADKPLLLAVQDLMQKIFKEFRFDPTASTVATPVLQTLENKRGVCQDFAHLMLSCLRSQGLSARYVSGYLLTNPPPGKPRLIGADASHAWISVYCPSAESSETPTGQWIDFDPTNNLIPSLEHITLGWGRDFGDISPLRGVILGGDTQEPKVAVTVLPEEEIAANR